MTTRLDTTPYEEHHHYRFRNPEVKNTVKARQRSFRAIEVERVNKVREGRPHIVDAIKNGQVQLIINTTEGRQSIADSYSIRRNALQHKVYSTTTLAGGEAVCTALKFGPERAVRRLQDLHKGI